MSLERFLVFLMSFGFFLGVKSFGYMIAANLSRRMYGSASAHSLVIGSTQAVFEIFLLMAYILVAASLIPGATESHPVGNLFFWLGLAPLMFLEWYIVLRVFHEKECDRGARTFLCLLMGTSWSYLLNIPVYYGIYWVLCYWFFQ